MSQKETYSIGELANEFEITTRSVRFYEDQGLLTPLRRGKTRIFDAACRTKLEIILRNKRVGFSLAETRELFDLLDKIRTGSAKQLMSLLGILSHKRTQLVRQKNDIYQMEVEIQAAEDQCRNALTNLKKKQTADASEQ